MVEERYLGQKIYPQNPWKAEEQRKRLKQNKNKHRTEYSDCETTARGKSHMHNVSAKEKMVPNLVQQLAAQNR